MDFYGIYKNCRNSAWQCLIDCGVSDMPISTLNIARKYGIKTVKNSTVNELQLSESGVSIYDGHKWYIVYDDTNTAQRSRFTIAHELGHILLGHDLAKGYHARTFYTDKPQTEQQADIFASRLLAPACVLWALDIHSAEDIAQLCNISMLAATARAERMAVLYHRNKFLLNPLEQRVYTQFDGYIKQKKRI